MHSFEHPNQKIGPILYALGQDQTGSRYRILCFGTEEPRIESNEESLQPVAILNLKNGTFWNVEFTVKQSGQTQDCCYTVNGETYFFSVPAADCPTLRLAYASCNGSEADSPSAELSPERVKLWHEIFEHHQTNPYHCLVMGGDQLYADSIWRDLPFLREWETLPRNEQYRRAVPADTQRDMLQYYMACYMTYWSQPGVREVLARIPAVMIWDDHDIFDGWGSWNKRFQASPTYQALFAAARQAFYLFQRGVSAPENTLHAGFSMTLGQTCIVAPDLRSERTRQQVMGHAGWTWLQRTLLEIPSTTRHVIFVSSVPLATSHFSALDPILTGFPSFIAKRLPKKINPKQFADDIHDQWRVPAHRQEWKILLQRLLDFSDETRVRVTVLSGEIHLGARSTIRRGQTTIHQFISSGVAHKPASAFVVLCCEWLSKDVQDIGPQIDIRMEKFFSTGRKRYLRARNWLTLELSQQSLQHKGQKPVAIKAVWHAENMSDITFLD